MHRNARCTHLADASSGRALVVSSRDTSCDLPAAASAEAVAIASTGTGSCDAADPVALATAGNAEGRT